MSESEREVGLCGGCGASVYKDTNEGTHNDDCPTLKPRPTPLVRLARPDGTDILRIEHTGHVEFGHDADLDEAARNFWHKIAGERGVLADVRAKLVVFLVGPMAGLPDHNRSTFKGYATLLMHAQYSCVDPTQLENFSPANSYESNLRITLAALLQCSAVALLPGWQTSPSAVREVEIATACGMPVAPVEHWLYDNPADAG